MSSTGDTRWDTLNSGDKLTGDGVGSVLNIITVDEAQGAGGQSETTTTDVTSAGFAAQVNAAVNAAEAAGAVAGEGGTFTLTAGAATGILTNEVNVGFTPEGKYLTAGNDVVDLSKWDGKVSVNIGDAFSNDNDKVTVMASALQNNGLKLTSIENLEIVNSGVKTPVTLTGANFKGLEVVKLIGDATTLDVSSFTQGVKIDATANADTITGSDKADTINGGAGNDIITGNGGNDVLIGGNGADTFVVGTVKDDGVDQILDFSAEDKISMANFSARELKKFDASTFSTVNYKSLDAALATFAAGGKYQTKAGDVVIFSYDGKTYALLANGAGFKEANDALVDITGANVASLTESNFGEFISQYNYTNVAAFNKDAVQGLIPANTAIITAVGSGDEALKTTDIQYIKDGGILSIASGATVSIELQGSGDKFDATSNDFVAKFASKVPALNITGTSGDDVIVASSFGGTIDGGSGNDTISLGAGKDTVVFDSNASTNGQDIITKFTAGANGDVLAISGLLGSAFTSTNFVAASAGTGKGDLETGSKQVLIHAGATAIDAATVTNSFSTSDDANHYKISSSQKLFVVDTVNNANILYLVDGSSGISITKVGTLNAGDNIAAALVAGNFGDVA